MNDLNRMKTPAGKAPRRGSLLRSSVSPAATTGAGEARSERESSLRLTPQRSDHLRKLFAKQKIRRALLKRSLRNTNLSRQVSTDSAASGLGLQSVEYDSDDSEVLQEAHEEVKVEELPQQLKLIDSLLRQYGIENRVYGKNQFPLEVRLNRFTYMVPVHENSQKIMTVYNSSFLYPTVQCLRRWCKGERKEPKQVQWRRILDQIDLVLEPGKMYLVLGPPGAGKTSLLKAISAHLHPSETERVKGSILYNGRELKNSNRLQIENAFKNSTNHRNSNRQNGSTDKHRVTEFFIQNAFGYIDQLDIHAPRMTVAETLDFAFQCKTGGGIQDALFDSHELTEKIREAERHGLHLDIVLAALGLSGVRDTIVGNTAIRGVSGGQRRRVTVGEMMMSRVPVLCGDEISTGLDAASTYDMIQTLTHFGRYQKMTRIISLLQPSPETVSLFDEMIVMGGGQIIYSGPVSEVEDYFAAIGYHCPAYMDVADFIQVVSSGQGAELYSPQPALKALRPDAPTIDELAQLFRQSKLGKHVQESLRNDHTYVWEIKEDTPLGARISQVALTSQMRYRYANSFPRNFYLLLKRFLMLWLREKRIIIASFLKNILMGCTVGGVFANEDDPVSLLGLLFQGGLFIMLGAMQMAGSLIEDRVIFYKHSNANFYSVWPFVLGRTVAGAPQTLLDVSLFGTLLYFLVGLNDRDISNYFLFLSILFTFAMMMNQQLAVFASFASASGVQVYSAVILLLFILFSGYIVPPEAIPDYYDFLYWWNPFAWFFRALVVQEFRGERWGDESDAILIRLGFVQPADGDPFKKDWIGYGFLFMILNLLVCMFLTGFGLVFLRRKGLEVDHEDDGDEESDSGVDEQESPASIPFKKIELSFQDVCYDVDKPKSQEKLRLLKNVNGIFRSGRMCALMGSSGAGKTTLMDVIAMRKTSGDIKGTILMNGWKQEAVSFRRSSGYVEQFDVQSPELTVFETIYFSARLRLDAKLVPSESRCKLFVEKVIRDMELTKLRDCLVGTEEAGGLSFDEKKRLSIAVELAASPSIIFLDEPTSGLDSRSALVVVQSLRRIVDEGRTVCATIHQPSLAVFSLFDDLLLLRTGGEVAYHGPLGADCRSLVEYFESKGAPRIDLGENPANWMLRVISGSPVADDLPAIYRESEEFRLLERELKRLAESPLPDLKIEYDNEFAAERFTRKNLVSQRMRLIYWRSPNYNLARLTVSATIAFILGSLFLRKRNPDSFTENDMRARFSVIFLSFIITGIMAILGVLPVMTRIRDMFYRHRTTGMYGSTAIGWGLGSAEKPFLIFAAALFSVVFLSVSGYVEDISRLIGFWGFFLLNLATYSYFGQAFVCLVKPMPTAVILCSVFIGLNNFFAGLIVRPQLMVGTFYTFPYHISPSHYVYEGLLMTLYREDQRVVYADPGGEFFDYLGCEDSRSGSSSEGCEGTVEQYIVFFFGGEFKPEHMARNAWILGCVVVLARVATFVALKYIRFK